MMNKFASKEMRNYMIKRKLHYCILSLRGKPYLQALPLDQHAMNMNHTMLPQGYTNLHIKASSKIKAIMLSSHNQVPSVKINL